MKILVAILIAAMPLMAQSLSPGYGHMDFTGGGNHGQRTEVRVYRNSYVAVRDSSRLIHVLKGQVLFSALYESDEDSSAACLQYDMVDSELVFRHNKGCHFVYIETDQPEDGFQQ